MNMKERTIDPKVVLCILTVFDFLIGIVDPGTRTGCEGPICNGRIDFSFTYQCQCACTDEVKCPLNGDCFSNCDSQSLIYGYSTTNQRCACCTWFPDTVSTHKCSLIRTVDEDSINNETYKINRCDPYPCKNGGTCLTLSNGYNCTCPKRYTGINCEEELCDCDCQYKSRLEVIKKVNSKPIEELEKEMQPLLKELKRNLTVLKKNLTSAIRKKISAPDDRKSSQQLGILGIVFISVVIGLVVLIDLVALKNYINLIIAHHNHN